VKASELVRHFAEMRGIPHRAAVVRASEVLFEVGLGEERFRPIGTMSTGQRQRVKLAQALVHDPELVLLDEPTNGLDPIQRDDMLALVRRIGTDLGFTVLISSHLLGEVEQVSDFIVMLEGGRVARSGSMKNLLGGDTPMVVEVVSGAKRLADFLSSKGFSAAAKDDLRLTVPASTEGVQDAVVAGVVELDIEMRRMERGAATLGELFDLEEAPAR
jgi:ABC-2 type transport system ATP-binding protein